MSDSTFTSGAEKGTEPMGMSDDDSSFTGSADKAASADLNHRVAPTPERTPVETVEELRTLDDGEMVEGYLGGFGGDAEPGGNRSKSYWHGWRNGHNDRTGKWDPASAKLADALVKSWRDDPSTSPRAVTKVGTPAKTNLADEAQQKECP